MLIKTIALGPVVFRSRLWYEIHSVFRGPVDRCSTYAVLFRDTCLARVTERLNKTFRAFSLQPWNGGLHRHGSRIIYCFNFPNFLDVPHVCFTCPSKARRVLFQRTRSTATCQPDVETRFACCVRRSDSRRIRARFQSCTLPLSSSESNRSISRVGS